MLGYLFYDKRDISRNEKFIEWLIEEALKYDLNLILHHTEDNLETLETPEFIINRSRVAFISHFYKDIKVFNNALVTEIANDKYKTYHYFKDDIPMLKTCLVSERTTFPCIVKSKSGHGGTDVFWVTSKEELTYSDEYIAQDIAPQLGKDLRVYILDNKIIQGILRTHETDFKSNYSLGGQAKVYDLSEQEKALVYKILEKLPLVYGGIDFLFDEHNHLILNEVEDAVGARMLYNLTDIKIVDDYIACIAAKLKNY
ncbi:MAG: ATP-grasp domain-containing protein [Clostridiales bacterium]|nr:ATP-grasp domain-containing protein [Clostridiales bacterium]